MTPDPQPILVGSYHAHGERHFLPLSLIELHRTRLAIQRWLSSFAFQAGQTLIVSSSHEQAAQFAPFDRAVAGIGLIPCSTENGASEAGRVEAIMRRFDPVAIASPDEAMIGALDPATVFAGKTVWLRPHPYAMLRNMAGLTARRWLDIGPAIAMECVAGQGAHIDRLEWDVGCEDGHILLTSRLPRSQTFVRWRSDVRGTVDFRPCACGSADPRIIIDAVD